MCFFLFTPMYWYVSANNQIAEIAHFDFIHVKPVLYNMLILIVFGFAFFAVALVIGKKKRLSYG